MSAVLDKAALRRLDARWGWCREQVAVRGETRAVVPVQCVKPRRHRPPHVGLPPNGEPVVWEQAGGAA